MVPSMDHNGSPDTLSWSRKIRIEEFGCDIGRMLRSKNDKKNENLDFSRNVLFFIGMTFRHVTMT